MDAEQLAAVRRLATPEEPALAAVRARAEQVTTPPAPEIGALLRLLAAPVGVRHAVEVGSAGGITAAWLLAGMSDRGVLTSVEADVHLHGMATAAYSDLGIDDRVRSIQGDPETVLDRLSDDQYELVLLQGDPGTHVRLVSQVERLLMPGGLLIARRVLAASPDGPAPLIDAVAFDPWADITVLPVDDGLLLARLQG